MALDSPDSYRGGLGFFITNGYLNFNPGPYPMQFGISVDKKTVRDYDW
jgi:hypothetical protein